MALTGYYLERDTCLTTTTVKQQKHFKGMYVPLW